MELDRISEEEPIDLLILCHSLSEGEAAQAVALVQARWPLTKVLTLSPASLRTQMELHGRVVLPANGASALVETVEKMLELPMHIQ